MTKSALIDQAVRAYFGIQTARYAGMSSVDTRYETDYCHAISRLEKGFGMTMNEIGVELRNARKVAFYQDFARDLLGMDAIAEEVAA